MRTLIIILLLLPYIVNAQQRYDWIRIYENATSGVGDVYRCVDDGFVLCGWYIQNVGPFHGFALKTQPNGVETWLVVFDNPRGVAEQLVTNVQCDDGGFIFGGVSGGVRRSDALLIRTSSDGNTIWRSYFGGEGADACYALIELKDGRYALAGKTNSFSDDYDGYVLIVNEDGELVWEENYGGNGDQSLHAMRETDGGLVIAGTNADDFWLIKVDFNGELLWSRTYSRDGELGREVEEVLTGLVSHPNGFYLSGKGSYGGFNGGFFWVGSVSDEGNLNWSVPFLPQNVGWSVLGGEIVRMPDNGIMFCAGIHRLEPRRLFGVQARLDQAGNIGWEMTFIQPVQLQNATAYLGKAKTPVLTSDGSVVVAGTAEIIRGQESNQAAYLIKYIPERSAPRILSHQPDSTYLKILTADIVNFEVRAVDLQEDSLRYLWILDEDTVSTRDTLGYPFDVSGDYTMRCLVSDGELADSVVWTIEVRDLYVGAFEPRSLLLRVRRGSNLDFSIQTRAVEGGQIHYLWELDGEEVGGGEPEWSHRFEQVRIEPYIVQAKAYRGESADSVRWEVYVRSAVWAWWPRGFEVSLAESDTIEFGVEPFEPESPNLSYRWYLDGEVWPDSAASASSAVNYAWPDEGRHAVSVMVRDGDEADSLVWGVRVYDPASVDPPIVPPYNSRGGDSDPTGRGGTEAGKGDVIPSELSLSAAPNPFNQTAEVRFGLPEASMVNLNLYDIHGRLVNTLAHGFHPAGMHSAFFTLHSALPAGVYLLRLQTEGGALTRKMVMLK